MNNKLIKPIIMDNGTNDMIYNSNVTVRRLLTLVNIKGGVSIYIAETRVFSAINDLKSKELTVTGKVIKAEDLKRQ